MQVVVTRPQDDAAAWVQALQERGHEVLSLPLLGIRAAPDARPVLAAWQHLGEFQAVMFVSGNAVRHFAAANAHPGQTWAQVAPHTRAWATGPGTSAALYAMGLTREQVDAPAPESGQFDSEHLWQRVQDSVAAGARVLIVRGSDSRADATPVSAVGAGAGRDWLATQLRAKGVVVQFVVAYERGLPPWSADQHAQAAHALASGALWLLSSSEAVANLGLLLPSGELARVRAHVTHERIGQAARAAGCTVLAQSRPTLADVLSSIESVT